MENTEPRGSNEEQLEELLKKHRQERKDLQAKIQALKKTAPKGKKKKEVQESVVRMEQELEAKQMAELSPYTNLDDVNEIMENNDIDENGDVMEKEIPSKVTRAQKRRNKKAEENKERDKRIAEQEEKNREGPRDLETKSIKELLKGMGLELYNIPADGNCLYCAINHQLKVTGREVSTVSNLRKSTAKYMRNNKDDFLPFMYSHDSDEPVDESQFMEYCKEVETTKLWGSQLELKALSNILKCQIKIIQAAGQPTIQGENFDGPPLVITYHRHLYRLGEHYNSTIEAVDNKV